MAQTAEGKNHVYTFNEIENWTDVQKCELIKGVPHLQARPSTLHQRILRQLFLQIGNYLQGKLCEAFIEHSVWLDNEPGDQAATEYLIPDLLIVGDPAKIKDIGIKGEPDVIIEILSASTAGVDKIKKFRKYQEAGVKE